MVQFKVLTLAKVAIISLSSLLSSCYGQEQKSIKYMKIYFSDTLIVSNEKIDVRKVEDKEIEVWISNDSIQKKISNLIKPTIILEFNGNKYIAKPNLIYSSSIPNECDYFYPINKEGKVFNINNGIILFYKILN